MADEDKTAAGSASIPPQTPGGQPEVAEETGGTGQKPPKTTVEFVEAGGPVGIPTGYTLVTKPYPQQKLPSGIDALVKLPSGQWVSYKEALKFFNGNIPTNAVVVERVLPETQEAKKLEEESLRPELGYQPAPKTKVTTPLAQRIRTRVEGFFPATAEEEKNQEKYEKLQKEIEKNPLLAEKIGQEQRYKEDQVDWEVAKKMIGSFKNLYYQAYAEAVGQKGRPGYMGTVQDSQIYALKYVYDYWRNLGTPINSATWRFVFSTLGPIGSLFNDVYTYKIGFAYRYYRSPLSPFYFDYLTRTLPEEKALELLGELGRPLGLLAQKVGLTTKIYKAEYDRDGYVKGIRTTYTPTLFLKLVTNLHGTGEFLERISETSAGYTSKKLYFRTGNLETKQKYLEIQRQINGSILPKNKEILLARLSRFLGAKSLSKNLKRTDRDPFSFLAVLIGSWIFDVIAGNLIRLVAEKITATAAWQKLVMTFEKFAQHPLTVSTQMGFRTIGHFARALPSFNTVAGGALGYNLGGALGQNLAQLLGIDPVLGFEVGSKIGLPVGAGLGWSYQWILNMAKDRTMMDWVRIYKPIDVTSAEFVKLPRWQQISLRLANILPPGPLQGFARFLSSPVGRFFRLPIKGFAVSYILSPFETQIQQVFPLYNSLMPPVLQYFWEIKGPLWNSLTAWAGNFLKFQSGEILSQARASQFLKIGLEVPGTRGLYAITETGQYLLEYELPGGGTGYKLVQMRGWYQRLINFRLGLANTFGPGGSLSWRYINLVRQHPTLFRTLKFTRNLTRVGITNFAGALIGFEIFSLLGWNPLLGAAIGWFATTPLIYGLSYGIYKILGFTPTQAAIYASSFVSRFFSGFWIGTGIQALFGIAGLNIPFLTPLVMSWWFPLGVGVVTAFLPSLMVGAGFLLQPIALGVGNFLVMAGTITAAWASGLAVFATVVGIGAVAAFALFAIILIGSAFWIPIQEQLAGITAVSSCFDISQPVFSDDQKPIFSKGQEKEVCWTTTNKQDFYQDAIVKTKTWDPPTGFTMQKYTVTVNVPGQNPVVWDNTSGDRPGSYNLSVSPFPSDPYVYNGYQFKITPPKDTGGLFKAQVASQISQIVTAFKSGTLPEELIDNNYVFPQIFSEVQRDYILQKELEALQNMGDDPKNIQPLKNAIDGFSYPKTIVADRMSTFCPSNTPACQFQLSCTRAQDDKLKARCKEYWDKITKDYTLDFKNRMSSDLSPIITAGQISAKDRLERINQLKEAINRINKGRDMARQEISLTTGINNRGIANKTGAELQTAIEALATEYAQKYPQNYLPSGSTITVCLTLKYNGEDNKVATLTEKDAAVLPVIGPLSVPGCQAQMVTPINATGPSNLQWPTDKRELAGRYDGHKGIDIKGTPGKPTPSATSGIIIKQGYEQNGFGYYRIIQGDDGYYYIYGHLGQNGFGQDSAFSNKGVGERINAGESVGYLGSSGNVTGPHLHFGISTNPELSSFYNNSTTTLDPCSFLQGGCP